MVELELNEIASVGGGCIGSKPQKDDSILDTIRKLFDSLFN
jgi:hypothetical protein